jgi:hypothetical protein
VRISVQVSAGELIDRITILELKLERLPPAAREGLKRELAGAEAVQRRLIPPSRALQELTEQLRATNLVLWNAEEELRECERNQSFGARFVELARSVYKSNDRRAALKSRIDTLVGSGLRECKSHALPEV